MRKHLVVAVFLSTLSTFQSAQSQYDEVGPGLEGFITAITDPNRVRHYTLASKQAAIHKWLINECMESRGLQGDRSSNPVEWNSALHGEYAHCEDHHIPGIDPPCPAENVVRAASDRSCWSVAKNKLSGATQYFIVPGKGSQSVRNYFSPTTTLRPSSRHGQSA